MALHMGFGLVQEQRMKMVMTPELRQAIQILQYSATDLQKYIEEQMEENPVLSLSEPDREQQELERWAQYIRDLPRERNWTGIGNHDADHQSFELYLAEGGTLADELESQLYEFDLTALQRKVCLYLIHNLDERGYLDLDSSEVCKRLLITEEMFADSLKIIQSMEPSGVGARSLEECVELQLRKSEPVNETAILVARNYLHDVADAKWRKIADTLQIEVREVLAAVEEIKTCNPKPGLQFNSAPPNYVYPDVHVEKIDGEYVVLLNERDTPALTVNRHYQQLLKQKEQLGEEVARYLKNWIQSALWLVKGIEQRRDTIYRVAQAIVSRQRDFFERGVDHLKPLTLKQIAEEVNLHESTVSRATQHKYMQTPNGLFPFRFFFPSGLQTEMGINLAQGTVQKKIQQMIDQENKKNPLSDQKIADRLREEGIRISRRTVAKYRDELGIASSTKRKRFP
ncbi:RNA polymerase factor sigma-54 [Thermoactinomyces mirandus]|uniref:RNA polymerase factor sigma-54 n=1 Tax=Thermoactinomyces mirandus TaxID=2756294 RepID=A0A7W1XVD0_9BACL|nr:RNA polymerase factor sigma-54 [Thermoactinomyces mirandus]MBA4603886.1 RNA polymerase factor sigma-54 [Thermoactinomyces mirandus]